MTHIKNICQCSVVTITPDASVQEAAHLMRDRHVGDVVVVERDRGILHPVGMLTDRDIVTLVVGEDIPPESVRVEDVMARSPKVVQQFDDISSAIDRMSEAGVRRLPVVDDRGGLVGIVSADDLCQILTQMQNALASISSQQIAHEVTGETLSQRFT